MMAVVAPALVHSACLCGCRFAHSAVLPASVDLAATAVALAALLALHVLPTGLAPAHHPVSQYGIGRYRSGYRVLTLALGVAGAATAAAVALAYPPAGRGQVVVLLAVFAVCRLVISWAPMDRPGGPRSTRGTVHALLALGAFVPVTVAAGRMWRAAQRSPALFSFADRAVVAAAFVLLAAGLVAMFLARRLPGVRRWFGALERVVYAGIFVLLFGTGIMLS